MSTLSHALNDMGIQTLTFDQAETKRMEALLTHLDAEFARIQALRPDKSEADLLLGLMTKTHLAALEQLQQTEDKSEAMAALFVQTLGAEHAARFSNQHSTDCRLVTRLWMLVLGYQHIELSYAAEHAESTAAQLFPEEQTGFTHSRAEQVRRQFMQAYYHGKEASQLQSKRRDSPEASHSFYKAIYCWVRRFFDKENR